MAYAFSAYLHPQTGKRGHQNIPLNTLDVAFKQRQQERSKLGLLSRFGAANSK